MHSVNSHCGEERLSNKDRLYIIISLIPTLKDVHLKCVLRMSSRNDCWGNLKTTTLPLLQKNTWRVRLFYGVQSLKKNRFNWRKQKRIFLSIITFWKKAIKPYRSQINSPFCLADIFHHSCLCASFSLLLYSSSPSSRQNTESFLFC